jgi:hypothetical protein
MSLHQFSGRSTVGAAHREDADTSSLVRVARSAAWSDPVYPAKVNIERSLSKESYRGF